VSASLQGAIYLYRQRHLQVSLLLGSGLSPAISPLTGQLQTRLQGSATLQVVADKTTIAGTADTSQTLPADSDTATRAVGLGVVATYRPGRAMELSAGYRTVIQTSNDPRYDLPQLWLAFISLGLYAPPIKL